MEQGGNFLLICDDKRMSAQDATFVKKISALRVHIVMELDYRFQTGHRLRATVPAYGALYGWRISEGPQEWSTKAAFPKELL